MSLTTSPARTEPQAWVLRLEAPRKWLGRAGLDTADLLTLNAAAEVESAAAQVVVTELVLKAASDLFDTNATSPPYAWAIGRTQRGQHCGAEAPVVAAKQRAGSTS